MDMKPATAWALVAIVGVMMGGAVALRVNGEDIAIIITLVTVLAVPVLAAFGIKVHENLQEIKSNTNGNSQRQVEINQQQQHAMLEALMTLQKVSNDNNLALQKMMTQIALQAAPMTPAITAEITEELRSDNTSQVHVP